jgi:hypothetical protein
MRAMLRRAALAGAGAIAAAITVVAGCDTYFIIGDDAVLLGQACEDGSLDCFATTGTGGSGGSPPGCVPSEDNKDIDDDCGVFVSPQGSDEEGQGTKDKPYLTLGMALGKAVSDSKPVYACSAEGEGFDGAVNLTGDVTVYGGFDCAEWGYDPTKRPRWTAPADAVPLRVTGESNVAVYDMVIEARDAEKAGGSSIAVLVVGDKAEVTLERCDVTAGAGKAGAPGVTPDTIGPNNEGAAGAAGGNGDDGDGNAGTMANVCTAMNPAVGGAGGQNQCGDTDAAGGLGGTGTNGNDGLAGQDGKPMPDGMEGTGGKPEDANGPCGFGQGGKAGQNGVSGPGATGIGTLTEAGYLGVAGQNGQGPGTPGQGGGGGGGAKKCANNNAGPGGGGGGAGGCGGLAGTGGSSGGVSIGVVSLNAKAVTLRTVTVTTAKGGDGAKGANGQPGGAGGNPGFAGGAGACIGGPGGAGGRGGSGGGGLGGHSVGIAFKGAPPTQGAVTFKLSAGGAGGLGGDDDMTVNGQSGLSCKSLNFDEGAASCAK